MSDRVPGAPDGPQDPEPVGQEASSTAPSSPDEQSTRDEQSTKEWWDDPSLPWSKQPTRADLWCWAGIAAIGIYALILLPLRPVLLGYTPYVLAAISGSRTAVVMIGALAATGNPWWWLGWILATISLIKFDWVYFWAGKLWGRGLLLTMTGDSPRTRRRYERVERWALKWSVPMVVVAFLPIPLPRPIIHATVGMAGMTWRTFIIVELISAAVLQALYMSLGYAIGEPAVRLMEEYARYMLWLSAAILVVMVIGMVWRARRKKAAASQ